MKTALLLLLAALLPGIAAAQADTPPRISLQIWVKQDGSQGFGLRAGFRETKVENAERLALESLPELLAEKRWCLSGWSITASESAEAVADTPSKPQTAIVLLDGVCRGTPQ